MLSPSVSSLIGGGMREVGGHKVLLRKISDRMYFGYEYIHMDEIGELVRVSDPEKTLMDIIYYRYPFSQDILPRLAKMADRRRLAEYIDEMRVRGVKGWTTVASRQSTSPKVVDLKAQATKLASPLGIPSTSSCFSIPSTQRFFRRFCDFLSSTISNQHE